MAKLKKQIVDYYSHHCANSIALRILQRKYNNDGYAVYYKIQDMLGNTPGHYIDCSNNDIWEDLLTYLNVSITIANAIINILVQFGEIDKDLWETRRIIWSDTFIDKIKDVYSNRKAEIPNREGIKSTTNLQVDYTEVTTNLQVDYTETTEQIKLNEIKLKESKVNNINNIADSDTEQPEIEELQGILDNEPIGSCKSLIKQKILPKNKHPPTDSLFKNIQFYFEELYGGEFTDYGKEGKAINGLIAKAKARAPTIDPFDTVKTVADKFKELKDGKVKYYVDQPCVPSSVNASGVWDRLIEKLRQEHHEDEQITGDDITDEFNNEVC